MTNERITTDASKEAVLYVIDKIRPEIEQGNFRPLVVYAKYLYHLIKIAAIIEERNEVGWPTITTPFIPEAEHRRLLDELES